jgi:poly(A) polymerase
LRKVIHFLKRVFCPAGSCQDQGYDNSSGQPRVVARSQHNLSRQNISSNCRKVLHHLHAGGYQAFLVGGSVRDLLLGHEPKDFDVATDATPEQVRKLFRNCRLIGRRFRLAHVFFKNEIIEVATFRANENDKRTVSKDGLVIRDNMYGTVEDDVLRRDFTINALLYDIKKFSIVDYVNGLEDLNHGLLRLIGDPATRYREDPVRILRAIRFAAKLGFRIEEHTAAPIKSSAVLLRQIASARLFEEVNKLFLSGYSANVFSLLLQYDLFGLLFPATQECLTDPMIHLMVDNFLQVTFSATDERVQLGQSVSIVFLLAAILWPPRQERVIRYEAEGCSEQEAKERASLETLSEEVDIIEIPRKMHHQIDEIWNAQRYLEDRRGKRPFRMVNHPRFRAGYDFLLLRAQADPDLEPLAQWWQAFYEADHEQRLDLIQKLQRQKQKGPRRKPRAVPAQQD